MTEEDKIKKRIVSTIKIMLTILEVADQSAEDLMLLEMGASRIKEDTRTLCFIKERRK